MSKTKEEQEEENKELSFVVGTGAVGLAIAVAFPPIVALAPAAGILIALFKTSEK
jgi:hypothetical protein